MLVDKFVYYTTDVLKWLGEILPADIILWIGGLLALMIALAARRLVY